MFLKSINVSPPALFGKKKKDNLTKEFQDASPLYLVLIPSRWKTELVLKYINLMIQSPIKFWRKKRSLVYLLSYTWEHGEIKVVVIGIGFKVNQKGCIWRERKTWCGATKRKLLQSFLKDIRSSEVSVRRNDEAKVGQEALYLRGDRRVLGTD